MFAYPENPQHRKYAKTPLASGKLSVDACSVTRHGLSLRAAFYLLFWFALSLSGSAPAFSGDQIVSREIFRDTTGRVGIEAIENQAFQPITGIFAGGYTRDTIWLRFAVRPASDGGPLVLRVLPSYLNELTLYSLDPNKPGGWHEVKNGNRLPWNDRPHTAISLEFSISPEEQAVYYLRLNTLSNALLHVEALTSKEAASSEIHTLLWQAFYIAIILWIIFWALQDYVIRREPVILVFALTYLSYLLYVIAILGFLPAILPGSTMIPETTFTLVTLAVFTSILFHRVFLGLYAVNRISRWGINGLLGASMIAVGLLILGHTQSALKLNSLLALIAGPCFFAISFTARIERFKIRTYYGLLCLSLVFYAGPILGLMQGAGWTLYGTLIQGLISAILFGHLLYTRSQTWAEEKQRGELQLKLARHQIEIHQDQLAEQGHFTAMLTHEIKNPLATIRFSLDGMRDLPERPRVRIQGALDEINTLVDQCALSDRIERGQLTDSVGVVDIKQMIEESIADPLLRTRLVLSIDGTAASVERRSQPLQIVLNNLIDNALKYSAVDASILVKISPQPAPSGMPGLQIEVSNPPGASGFPEAQYLFDKYYRGPNTSRQQGFGLGLYLVKTLVQQQGWEIAYQPTDELVTFRLWIPLSPDSTS